MARLDPIALYICLWNVTYLKSFIHWCQSLLLNQRFDRITLCSWCGICITCITCITTSLVVQFSLLMEVYCVNLNIAAVYIIAWLNNKHAWACNWLSVVSIFQAWYFSPALNGMNEWIIWMELNEFLWIECSYSISWDENILCCSFLILLVGSMQMCRRLSGWTML
jgi:hypothetical protein